MPQGRSFAKDVIEKTLRLRDCISNARNRELNSNAHIKRLDEVDVAKRDLEVTKIEAQAVFGETQVIEIENLIKKVRELYLAFTMLNEKEKGEEGVPRELRIKARWIVYGNGEEGDKFGQEIVSISERIEEQYRKFLK